MNAILNPNQRWLQTEREELLNPGPVEEAEDELRKQTDDPKYLDPLSISQEIPSSELRNEALLKALADEIPEENPASSRVEISTKGSPERESQEKH